MAALACLHSRPRGVYGYLHVWLRHCEWFLARSGLSTDKQGLGGGLIALPSFAKDFGFIGLSDKALADRKGNIVSILQAGW